MKYYDLSDNSEIDVFKDIIKPDGKDKQKLKLYEEEMEKLDSEYNNLNQVIKETIDTFLVDFEWVFLYWFPHLLKIKTIFLYPVGTYKYHLAQMQCCYHIQKSIYFEINDKNWTY